MSRPHLFDDSFSESDDEPIKVIRTSRKPLLTLPKCEDFDREEKGPILKRKRQDFDREDKELIVKRRSPPKKKSKVIQAPYEFVPNYDNDTLPDVRMPCEFSVPDHLLEEFQVLFPDKVAQKIKGKFNLAPVAPIEGKEREFINASWMLKFWTPENLDVMVRIVLHQSPVTLSLIDWLCINYGKSKDIHYSLIGDPRDPKDFYIWENYNNNLDDFGRPCFDSFCRNQRILVEYESQSDMISISDPYSLRIEWDSKKNVGTRMMGGKKMVYLVTSVGQLIFFWWAINNRVIEYCEEHLDDIKQHMAVNKQKPKDGPKRRKLTQQAQKSWFVKKVSIVLKYDHVNAMLASTRPKPVEVEEQKKLEFVWQDPVYKDEDEDWQHEEDFVTSELA